jgi:hypothetical protein
VNAYQHVAVIRLDIGEELTLPRIPMKKVSHGMKFARWQVPLRLIFAGTVHRSQGMTLHKAVIDLRTEFCEHGQLYVALSRVRNSENLCVLLHESSDQTSSTDLGRVPLRIPAEAEVVEIVSAIHPDPTTDVDAMPATSRTEKGTEECTAQWDDDVDHNARASGFSSTVLSIQWSEGESEVGHVECNDVAQENPTVPFDDMTRIDVATEATDSESEEPDISRTVNIGHLCDRTVASAYSILASAIGRIYPRVCLMLCLPRIRVMVTKFLIVYRMSKGGINPPAFQFRMAIGGGFENEDHMCYLISVVQIFYHMEVSEQY